MFISKHSGYLTSTQLEMCYNIIQKKLKKKSSVFLLSYPQKAVSKKPIGVRIGKGKGSVNHYTCKVFFGQKLFRVDIKSIVQATQIKTELSKKLPIDIDIQIQKVPKRSFLLIYKQLTQW